MRGLTPVLSTLILLLTASGASAFSRPLRGGDEAPEACWTKTSGDAYVNGQFRFVMQAAQTSSTDLANFIDAIVWDEEFRIVSAMTGDSPATVSVVIAVPKKHPRTRKYREETNQKVRELLKGAPGNATLECDEPMQEEQQEQEESEPGTSTGTY